MYYPEEDASGTTRAPRQNPLLTFAREHLALVVPLVGALIFAIRCVIVSEGDPYVASMLVATTSVGDAIRALLFTVMPALLTSAAWVFAFASATRLVRGGWRNYETLGVGIVAAAFSVALSLVCMYLFWFFEILNVENPTGPVGIAIIALLPFIVAFPLVAELRKVGSRKGMDLMLLPTMVVSAVAAFALLILPLLGPSLGGNTFWLPRERLDFKTEAAFTGYVLKVSEDHLIILNDSPRVIVEKDKELLQDRDFCYPEDHKARSSNVKSDTPVCP